MYIGRDVDNISNVEKLDNITFDGGTTYALEKSSVAYTPSGANNILISIDGIVQQGNFSVSTTNIVFDWSPTSSNTCDWIMHFGTGVLNIPADGTVTLAKMAVNSIDSDQYVDASIDNAHLADDAVGVAELSATGTASSSTFLRGDNAWAAAGGGKVLQVVTASFAGQVGTTSTSWADTGIAASITPASTSNKVLVMVNFTVHNSQADYGNFQTIFRGDSSGTNLGPDATGLGRVSGRAGLYHMCSMHILDSPSTTSSQAYETGFKNTTTSLASYTMINNITAKITLMEIDGT